MARQYLLYYNHREDKLPLQAAIQAVCQKVELEFKPLGEMPDWLNNCRAGIIHGTPMVKTQEGGSVVRNYYEYLSHEEISSADGLVVLFVSRGLQSKPIKKIHFRHKNGGTAVRYLLPIRQTKESGLVQGDSEQTPTCQKPVERWESLIRTVLDRTNLDAWFENRAEPAICRILDDLFLNRASAQTLQTIALLSQAYLIVHAEHKGVNKAYWSDEDIAPALARIGWNDDMANEAADSLLIKPALGSEADIEAVCRADWWREVFEGAELHEATQKEWDEPNNGAMPEAVTELINQIQNSPRIAPPSRVAKAYCAIADRLERRRFQ
jgi:hypothetical protein